MNTNKDFARECLVNALIELMHNKPISEISIVDLVNKAGVSRMTYYRNYECKEDILKNYLAYVIDLYSQETSETTENSFGKFDNVKLGLIYFYKYEKFTSCLIKANLTHILLDGLTNYIINKANRLNLKIDSLYLYAYSGSIFNIYLKIMEGKETRDFNIIGKKMEKLISFFNTLE